jgi:hypothetical protein
LGIIFISPASLPKIGMETFCDGERKDELAVEFKKRFVEIIMGLALSFV